MNIQTRHNIGDRVFIFVKYGIVKRTIQNISVEVRRVGYSVPGKKEFEYKLAYDVVYTFSGEAKVNEKLCFANEEDLMASIKDQLAAYTMHNTEPNSEMHENLL